MAAAFGLAVGAAAGVLGSPVVGEQSRTEIATTVAAAGDEYPAFKLDVAPRVSSQDRAGTPGELVFDVTLENRFERPAAFQLAHVFADDRGNPVSPASKGALVDLQNAGERTISAIRSPGKLGDGYYELRVTAAGSDGETDVVLESEKYMRVRKGVIVPVSSDEWLTRSAAMMGHEAR